MLIPVLGDVDLVVEHQQQPALGGHPGGVGLGQPQGSPGFSCPPGPNMSPSSRDHPTLARAPRARWPSARCATPGPACPPVPHQLGQPPQLDRGDVGARETTQAAADPASSRASAQSVFTRRPLETLQPLRVRQRHLEPGGRQRVHRPVPAIGGLQPDALLPGRPWRPPQPAPPGRCRCAPRPTPHHRNSSDRSRCADDADRSRRTRRPMHTLDSRRPPFTWRYVSTPRIPRAPTGAGGPLRHGISSGRTSAATGPGPTPGAWADRATRCRCGHRVHRQA